MNVLGTGNTLNARRENVADLKALLDSEVSGASDPVAIANWLRRLKMIAGNSVALQGRLVGPIRNGPPETNARFFLAKKDYVSLTGIILAHCNNCWTKTRTWRRQRRLPGSKKKPSL